MWLTSGRKRKNAPSGNRLRRAYRPQLEALEDRCLLNAGALDPTFGNSAGYVTTSLSSSNDSASQVLVQPSGNIVAAGTTTITVTTTTHHGTTTTIVPVFGVVTYNPDGSLDTAFGSGGIVKQPFTGQGIYGAYLHGAALEPTGAAGDDKIVLAGSNSAQYGLALMRLNPNGSLDTSFGSSGQVVTLFNPNDAGRYGPGEYGRAVAVTASGQIVAAGDNSNSNWLIARYNPNGSLDTTFGSGGEVTTTLPAPGPGFNVQVSAMALQPDGKVVVDGFETWNTPAGASYFRTWQGVVVRYNTNGSLDTTFGNGGIVYTVLATGTPSTGTATQDYGLAIYPNAGTANDGEIVVAGRVVNASASGAMNNTYQPLVARYNANGSLDSTFGNGAGYITIGTPVHAAFWTRAVTIESDGKPVLVGTNGGVFMAARLNVDGSLDSTFGQGGLVTTAMLGNGQAWAVALQSDGKIVAAGNSEPTGGNSEFAVARYLPSEPEIGSFTATANPVTAGSSETLTVSNITDGNAGSTITQVAFYYFDNSGTKHVLGYGTQASPGVWTLTFTVNLAPGTYTLFAQAEDSYGVFGDPFALTLTVQ